MDGSYKRGAPFGPITLGGLGNVIIWAKMQHPCTRFWQKDYPEAFFFRVCAPL